MTEQFFKTKEKVETWLIEMGLMSFQWTIHDDLYVSIQGDVNLQKKNLSLFPVHFKSVTGCFDCSENQLTSLVGAPDKVGVYFDCSKNQLKTLEGGPHKIGTDKKMKEFSDYYCQDNQLVSLKGAPEKVPHSFTCSHNKLGSLEYGPREVGANFDCEHNMLPSLKGAPVLVNGNFNCSFNALQTLEYSPEGKVEDFLCSHNQLKSLKGITPVVESMINCSHNQLSSFEYFPTSPFEGCVGLHAHCNQFSSFEFLPRVFLAFLDISDNCFESLQNLPEVGDDLFCYNNPLKNLTQVNWQQADMIFISPLTEIAELDIPEYQCFENNKGNQEKLPYLQIPTKALQRWSHAEQLKKMLSEPKNTSRRIKI